MDDPDQEGPDSLADDLGNSMASLLRAVAATPPAAPPPVLEPGTLILETFRIERTIGSGGMGVVYLARDLRLQRDVAIKLHTHPSVALGAQRLWREAEALARLSHPNVVSVYEVGLYAERVFVVMEYVQGGTARDLCARPTRSWREVLALFLDAGAGLSAAHEAGLVHRDFKPENILIGADGRARVADFGLARAAAPAAGAPAGAVPAAAGGALAETLTQTDALMGTPAYMAPEQVQGGAVDARADQYSFCVSLHEALHGRRPSAADATAAAGAAVPRWLRQVLRRGLCPDPAGRYPDMRALLRAIARRQRLGARLAAAGAVVVAIAAAIGVTLAVTPKRALPTCGPLPQALSGAWDALRKDAVRASLLATGAAYAPDTWTAVLRLLDQYAARWLDAQREACEATHVRGVQSPALLDRQRICLSERARDLGAFTDVLTRADATVVERAARGAMNLPSIAPCLDPEAVSRQPEGPADPARAARAEALRRQLAAGRALRLAGKYADARAALEPAVSAARALDFPPLVAEAQVAAGQVLAEQGESAPAEAALTDGYFLAREAGREDLSTTAALALALGVGAAQARFDDGLLWARHALAAAQRGSGQDVRAQALRVFGVLLVMKGRQEEGQARLAQALALVETLPGDQRLLRLTILESLGYAAASSGKGADAIAHHRRALELAEEVHGASHPLLATSLSQLGLDLADAERPADALPYLERALRLTEAAFGPDHRKTAPHLENLAVAEIGLRRHAQARAHLSRACAVLERDLGGGHLDTARCQVNLAEAQRGEGRHGEALVLIQRGLETFRKAYGPDHAEVARVTGNLGEVLLALGRLTEAEAALERSIAIWDRTAPAHPWRAAPLDALGQLRRRRAALTPPPARSR